METFIAEVKPMFSRVNKHHPASIGLQFCLWAGVHGDSVINTELAHMEKLDLFTGEA